MTYGTFPIGPALSWPVKEPLSILDYTYTASGVSTLTGVAATRNVTGSADIDPATNPLETVSVSISPSGPGELVASQLSVAGALITMWLSGGVPGRSYTVSIVGTTSKGQAFQWAVGIVVDPAFASYPLPTPASSGFGAALVWELPSLDFTQPSNSGLLGAI